MQDAGADIPVNLCIASPFSRQLAIGNGVSADAFEPMGAKPIFTAIH